MCSATKAHLFRSDPDPLQTNRTTINIEKQKANINTHCTCDYQRSSSQNVATTSLLLLQFQVTRTLGPLSLLVSASHGTGEVLIVLPRMYVSVVGIYGFAGSAYGGARLICNTRKHQRRPPSSYRVTRW